MYKVSVSFEFRKRLFIGNQFKTYTEDRSLGKNISDASCIDCLYLILQEDEKNQDILNEKLSQLNRKEQHDPVLALGRDNVYEEELWEEHFEEWESGKDSSFDHVVKSNASQLCAVAAMRTIEMAQAQHRKYIKTYRSLEKTGKSYKKVIS